MHLYPLSVPFCLRFASYKLVNTTKEGVVSNASCSHSLASHLAYVFGCNRDQDTREEEGDLERSLSSFFLLFDSDATQKGFFASSSEKSQIT